MTSSAPRPWQWPPHGTHHPGHVVSPTQAHEFPARPAGTARQRFAQSVPVTGIPPLRGAVPLCSTGPALILAPLCCRTRASPPVQRRSCSRRFAALRTPQRGRCLATRPVAGRRAGSVNSGQSNEPWSCRLVCAVLIKVISTLRNTRRERERPAGRRRPRSRLETGSRSPGLSASQAKPRPALHSTLDHRNRGVSLHPSRCRAPPRKPACPGGVSRRPGPASLRHVFTADRPGQAGCARVRRPPARGTRTDASMHQKSPPPRPPPPPPP